MGADVGKLFQNSPEDGFSAAAAVRRRRENKNTRSNELPDSTTDSAHVQIHSLSGGAVWERSPSVPQTHHGVCGVAPHRTDSSREVYLVICGTRACLKGAAFESRFLPVSFVNGNIRSLGLIKTYFLQ